MTVAHIEGMNDAARGMYDETVAFAARHPLSMPAALKLLRTSRSSGR
jgi:hypothetical protein